MIQRIRRRLKGLFGRTPTADPLSALERTDVQLIQRIQASRLTYLADTKLASLVNTCRAIESKGLDGIFVEAGCALGGSTILIALRKRADRPFNVYDVFGMIPPPTQEDTKDVHERYRSIVEGKSSGIGGDQYYGYRDDLYEVVRSNLVSFEIDTTAQRISLIKGLVQDTLHIDEPVAFAHVDVDWYDPVMTCLQRIFPRLVVGGCIILDDYHDWGGCRKAADEFLRSVTGQFALDDSARSMKVIRTKF